MGFTLKKLHDIQRLIDLCRSNKIQLPDYVASFIELNPFAVEGRYAIIADDMTDAQFQINLLNQLKGFVSENITQPAN